MTQPMNKKAVKAMIQAKILLDLPSDMIETLRLEEQWENEGGSASNNIMDEWISETPLPFSPGDSFKVVSGRVEEINNQFFYSVSLEKIETEVHQ